MNTQENEQVTNSAPAADAGAAEKRAAAAEAARLRATQLLAERNFSEARKALDEAAMLSAEPTAAEIQAAARKVQAEAARSQAAQLIGERKFAEARKALEEADRLDGEPTAWRTGTQRFFGAVRSILPKRDSASSASRAGDSLYIGNPVERSMDIVRTYSKVAAAAGILPGGLLNFAAILAVQVTMVWNIAKTFGHDESKERIRGSILSLIGSVLPTGIGHGAAFAVASIPAMFAGAVVYFVATPVLAYALTQAVGNAFIMHFESGGTLLTFNPKAFADHFIQEFKKAGGVIADAATKSEPAEPAAV